MLQSSTLYHIELCVKFDHIYDENCVYCPAAEMPFKIILNAGKQKPSPGKIFTHHWCMLLFLNNIEYNSISAYWNPKSCIGSLLELLKIGLLRSFKRRRRRRKKKAVSSFIFTHVTYFMGTKFTQSIIDIHIALYGVGMARTRAAQRLHALHRLFNMIPAAVLCGILCFILARSKNKLYEINV